TGTTVDTGGDPGDDIDDDRDGYTENDGDCNDDPRAGGRRIFPGAVEVCTDGLDNDCDGLEDYDDGDDCTEPGVGYAYWVGDAYVCDPETFGGGHFGLEMLNEDGNSTCVVMGDWYDDGGRTPRSACPGCDWMFSLSLRDSVAAGPYCDDYGFTDGMFDGYFQYVWAFAETYYSYENVLFIYYGGSWYPIWETDGDATHFTLSASSGSYYYYYP
ncbi:MAG: putative metal-binding motif-containing protein, partial [Myxococcota bacterium]